MRVLPAPGEAVPPPAATHPPAAAGMRRPVGRVGTGGAAPPRWAAGHPWTTCRGGGGAELLSVLCCAVLRSFKAGRVGVRVCRSSERRLAGLQAGWGRHHAVARQSESPASAGQCHTQLQNVTESHTLALELLQNTPPGFEGLGQCQQLLPAPPLPQQAHIELGVGPACQRQKCSVVRQWGCAGGEHANNRAALRAHDCRHKVWLPAEPGTPASLASTSCAPRSCWRAHPNSASPRSMCSGPGRSAPAPARAVLVRSASSAGALTACSHAGASSFGCRLLSSQNCSRFPSAVVRDQVAWSSACHACLNLCVVWRSQHAPAHAPPCSTRVNPSHHTWAAPSPALTW